MVRGWFLMVVAQRSGKNRWVRGCFYAALGWNLQIVRRCAGLEPS